MADYNQPDYVTKRPRYFTDQYLSEQDFIDEQRYHIDRQRRHDRLLHVSGIAEGLEVTAAGAIVTVTAGTAVDEQGRHLLLDTARTLKLASDHQGTRVVYLCYQEVPSDEVVGDLGVTGHTRFDESAYVGHEKSDGPATEGRLLLAELTVAADGTVTDIKTDMRQYSGLRLSAPGGKTLTLRASSDGSLALGAGDQAGKLSLGAKGSVIELGAGVAGKHPDAGKIGYALLEPKDSLDIVGVGTSNTDRKVKVWAEGGATFTGPLRLPNYLELGAGVAGKEPDAGKIIYRDWLVIVGAGTDKTNRKVAVWAEGGTSFSGPGEFNGSLRLPDQPLYLRSADNNHGLEWYGGGKFFGNLAPDGPMLFGYAGGGLCTRQNRDRVALAWNQDGSVKLDSNNKGDLYASGFPERVRMIRGSVLGNLSQYIGKGFTPRRAINNTTIGLYDISFDQPFTGTPTVVVTQQQLENHEIGGFTLDNAVIVMVKPDSVRIKTGDNLGIAVDRDFHFIAVGT